MDVSDLPPELQDAINGREDAAEQADAYRKLRSDRAETTIRRLRALAQYDALNSPPQAETEKIAETVNMSATAFYRLAKRVREHGPVMGAAPWAQRTARRSVERDGMLGPAERALRQVLEERPEASASQVVKAVNEAMRMARRRHVPESTIRLRLDAVRPRRPDRYLKPGGELIIVQTVTTELMMEFVDGVRVPSDELVLTLIVDGSTRLVLGYAKVADHRESLLGALHHAAATGVAALAANGIRFATALSEVQLELPDALAEELTAALRRAALGSEVRRWQSDPTLLRKIVGAQDVPDDEPFRGRGLAVASLVAKWNRKVVLSRRKSRRQVDDGSALRTTLTALANALSSAARWAV